MKRYTLVLSAVVLSTLSLAAHADATSDAERQVAQHSAMGAQARASKDFGMAAHCARLVQKYQADANALDATAPQDPAARAARAARTAEAHEAMLATASTHRDPGMAAHCRQQIETATAEAAAQRALTVTSR